MRFPHYIPFRIRLAAGYVAFLLGVIGVLGLFVETTLESSLQLEADEALALRADHVERMITTTEPAFLSTDVVPASLLEVEPLDEFASPGVYVLVFDYSGHMVARSSNLPHGPLPAQDALVDTALAGASDYVSVPVGGERLRIHARPLRAGERTYGAVLVAESMHQTDLALRQAKRLLVIGAALAASAAFIGGWWLTGRAFRPIVDVTAVARRIAATGRFEQRIAEPGSRDEIGELVSTVNVMLARLDSTFRHQREFLADASHELRGPLMIIGGNLDLLRLDLRPDDRAEAVREAAEEVNRMGRLVGDLLFLSRVDVRETMQGQPVAFDELVRDVFAQAYQTDSGEHKLALDAEGTITIYGDSERLRQLIWNLVENAMRYSGVGEQVTVVLRHVGRQAELSVADTGIGIAAEHLPRIFDRFYRVDPARARHKYSTGLGLAIVKQVAEAHGGQVHVRSRPGVGSIFTVTLPILESEATSPLDRVRDSVER